MAWCWMRGTWEGAARRRELGQRQAAAGNSCPHLTSPAMWQVRLLGIARLHASCQPLVKHVEAGAAGWCAMCEWLCHAVTLFSPPPPSAIVPARPWLRFVSRLVLRGYQFDLRVLNAAHYGCPQSRMVRNCVCAWDSCPPAPAGPWGVHCIRSDTAIALSPASCCVAIPVATAILAEGLPAARRPRRSAAAAAAACLPPPLCLACRHGHGRGTAGSGQLAGHLHHL